MKLTDGLFIIKNKIFKKDNVLLITILSLIFVAIFTCITITNFVSVFRTNMLNTEEGRTLLIGKPTEENLKELEKIKHIELIESQKYLHSVEKEVQDFDQPKAEGIVQLSPLLKDTDVKIIKGDNIKNEGEIICPVRFYPHSINTGDKYNQETNFYNSYILNTNNMIGKTINIENEEGKFTLKIVGSYENKILIESNNCYISKQDFDKLKSNIDYCSDDICYEYSSLIVRVDKHTNIEQVEKELETLGYPSMRVFTFDEEILTSLTYIPTFISTIISIISMAIIYNFFRKKISNNQHQYGVLKSIGYTNTDIKKITILEGIIINCISIVIAFILYFIGYNLITNNLLHEFNYNSFIVPIPLLYISLFIIISIIYIILIIIYLINKRLNLYVQNLFEGAKLS